MASKDPVIFTEEDWRVLDSLQVRNYSALKGITDEMNKNIVRELSEGINAGEGMGKLSERLQKNIDMSKTRADRFARTETINAAVDGAKTRYEQLGVTEFEYIAASDSRTCEVCADNDGKIFKLTDRAHLPPIHPNCRCAIAPIIGNRKREIQAAELEKNIRGKKPILSTQEFSKRSDLTDTEKTALRSYQDIGNKQHEWSCEIPDGEEHHDCYVINKSLRDPKFRQSLSVEDMIAVGALTSQIDEAIAKSPLKQEVQLMKGLDNADWIRNKKIDDSYTDEAYGSYTTSFAHSMDYAALQKDGARVFILYHTPSRTHGVYMGSKEEEILLSRNIQYHIDNIVTYEKGELLPDSKAIFYYVTSL